MGTQTSLLRVVAGELSGATRGVGSSAWLKPAPLTVCVAMTCTGDRAHAEALRAYGHAGSTIELRPYLDGGEGGSLRTVGVWARCSLLFGLWSSWKQIGVIRANASERWASRLAEGSFKVERAIVSSYDPICNSCLLQPKASLRIEFVPGQGALIP